VAAIEAGGGQALALQADLTNSGATGEMMGKIKATYGRIDVLILNASGGMERDVDPGYALRLNRDAQLSLVDRAMDLMRPGSRIVFVTSHQAHFHGSLQVIDAYEPVARSKRAGEDALRARIPELTARGIDLVVVSGDMIEGTITVVLLERASPGIVDARRSQVGQIPTVKEFASAVASAATAAHPTGHTVYVGGHD
jgi:3-oxoacyl-[acyl-carrier protein] reductase